MKKNIYLFAYFSNSYHPPPPPSRPCLEPLPRLHRRHQRPTQPLPPPTAAAAHLAVPWLRCCARRPSPDSVPFPQSSVPWSSALPLQCSFSHQPCAFRAPTACPSAVVSIAGHCPYPVPWPSCALPWFS